MAVPIRILVLGLLMVYVTSVEGLPSDRTGATGKQKQSVYLKRLVKRFNPEMFACGTCTSQMECRTDVDCENIHTHAGYKCRVTCCGLLCIGHENQHLFHHLLHQDGAADVI